MLCLVARKESKQRNRNKNLVRWRLRRWSKQAKWYYHIKQHKNTGKMITSLSPHIFLVFPGDQTVQTRQQRNAKLSVHEKGITKRKAYRNVRVSRERERESWRWRTWSESYLRFRFLGETLSDKCVKKSVKSFGFYRQRDHCQATLKKIPKKCFPSVAFIWFPTLDILIYIFSTLFVLPIHFQIG